MSKHVYTCPDIIYIRNRNKKINRINLGALIFTTAGLIGWGWWQDRKDKQELENQTEEI